MGKEPRPDNADLLLTISDGSGQQSSRRGTDANHVIMKNPALAANLHATVGKVISGLGSKDAAG